MSEEVAEKKVDVSEGNLVPEEPEENGKLFDHHLINVLFLSFSFVLLYGPYFISNSIAKYALDLHGMSDVGFLAIGIIYASFGLSSFIAPIFLVYFPARILLFCCSFTFSIYLFSYTVPVKGVILTIAFILGFTNSILWASHSTYLTRNSTPKKFSRDVSVFRGMFGWSTVFASAFLYSSLKSGKSSDKDKLSKVYLTFGFITLAGAISLIIIWFRSRNDKRHDVPPRDPSNQIMTVWRKNLWKVLSSPNFLLLIPLICQTGLSIGFMIAIYPSFLPNIYTNETKIQKFAPSTLIGEYGMVSSSTILLTSMFLAIMGTRMTDRVNIGFMIFGTITAVIGYSLPLNFYKQFKSGEFSFYPKSQDIPHRTITFSIAILLGITEGIINTRLTTITGLYFVETLPEAFCMSKFFMTATVSLFTTLGSKISLSARIYIAMTFQILTGFTYSFLVLKNMKKESPETNVQDE